VGGDRCNRPVRHDWCPGEATLHPVAVEMRHRGPRVCARPTPSPRGEDDSPLQRSTYRDLMPWRPSNGDEQAYGTISGRYGPETMEAGVGVEGSVAAYEALTSPRFASQFPRVPAGISDHASRGGVYGGLSGVNGRQIVTTAKKREKSAVVKLARARRPRASASADRSRRLGVEPGPPVDRRTADRALIQHVRSYLEVDRG
jgi:hypothetical protein